MLFAVQMKLIVDPRWTVWDLGSSTVTSMALDGTPSEIKRDNSLTWVGDKYSKWIAKHKMKVN